VTTKRRKIPPNRIGRELPPWAWDWLRTGKEPGEGEPGYDAWFGFAFCGEEVVGLGRMLTEEDAARMAQLKKAARRWRPSAGS
jgi:hypothetical protein